MSFSNRFRPPSRRNHNKTALIMAGGTGGHIFPGIAVARALEARGWQIAWLGSKGGMEEKIIGEADISLNLVNINGLRGNGALGWLKAPFRLTRAVREAARVLAKEKPVLVLGFGGFASGPGGIAAFFNRTPLIIHEQNAVAGLTNRVLAKVSMKIFQAFPATFSEKSGALTVGNPVREEIAHLNLVERDETGDKADSPLNLLVLGGSRGAVALNRELPAILARVNQRRPLIIRHQVGAGRLEQGERFYHEAGLDNQVVHCLEFIDDVASAMEWADLIICRAGASTVSEVAAASRCAIFIPYPFAVDDHQTANANWLVRQSAGLCFDEKEIAGEIFGDTLINLVKEPEKIKEMAVNAGRVAFLNAADEIADYCEKIRKQAA